MSVERRDGPENATPAEALEHLRRWADETNEHLAAAQRENLIHLTRELGRRRAAKRESGRRKHGWRKGPPDDELRSALAAHHRENPRHSWTEACKRVGEAYSLSYRAIQTRVPDTRW